MASVPFIVFQGRAAVDLGPRQRELGSSPYNLVITPSWLPTIVRQQSEARWTLFESQLYQYLVE